MTKSISVAVELLDQLAGMELDTTERSIKIQDELRAILAQPAEAEGVDLVPFLVLFDATTPEPLIKKHMPEGVLAFFDNEEDARRAKALHPGTDYKRAPYVRAAALSAVTAERDRLRKDAERWRYVSLQGDDTHWLNLLRVDLEDFGGNINAAVDALIDGDTPATAAKEE